MSDFSLPNPYSLFTETDGTPLESGYIYIGEDGKNPETDPITVYWDAGRTIAAAQPLRTLGGYIIRNGSAARIYIKLPSYSITVRSKTKALVHSELFDNTFSGVYGDYESLYSLMTTAPQVDGLIVNTIRFHAAIDGGGKSYYWDSTQNQSNANGGTIIDPDIAWDGTIANFATQYYGVSGQGTGSGTGCWMLIYNDTYTINQFGAYGDLVIDDILAIEAAQDAAEGNFITVTAEQPSVGYLHTRPLRARIKSSFIVDDSILFYNDDSQGDFWSGNSWLCTPVGGGTIFNNGTRYDVASISDDSKTITFDTAADSDNFKDGQVVLIRTDAEYTVGAVDFAVYTETNVVETVTAGVLNLRHQIGENQTNCHVISLADFSYNEGGTNPPTGDAAFDFTMRGGIWKTNSKHFCTQMMACDINMHPHGIIGLAGIGYTSGAGRSNLSVDWELVEGHSADLAVGSHDTVVRKGSVTVSNHTANTQVVNTSESGRNNRIIIQTLGVVGTPAMANGLANIQDSRDNRIEIFNTVGAITGGSTAKIQQPNHTGTNPGTYGNEIIIHNSRLDSQVYYGAFTDGTSGSPGCHDNIIRGNFYGAVTTNAINFGADAVDNKAIGYLENGTVVYGGVNVTDNDASGMEPKSLRELRRITFNDYIETVTTAAPYSNTRNIPADTCEAGDQINFSLIGDGSGATDTKTITVTFAGTTAATIVIPTGAPHTELRGKILIASNTEAYFLYEYHEDTALTRGHTYISGKNFTTTAYTLVTGVTVANAADSYALKTFDVRVYRPRIDSMNSI